MAICMVLRFHIPNLGFSGTMAYYLIVLMSFSIGFTMACVPGQALISVLSTDYNKRNILMTIRALSGTVLGAIVSIAALLLLIILAEGQRDGKHLCCVLRCWLSYAFTYTSVV